MKRKLTKFLAVLMAFSVMAFSCIPVSADVSHIQSSKGASSGSQFGIWSLSVTSAYASSNGTMSGYTSRVYCKVIASGTVLDSVQNNSTNISLNGDGTYAEVTFYGIEYDHNVVVAGYGESRNEYLQCNWFLSVTSINAISQGWMDSGYIGLVQCDVFTDNDSYSSTGVNSNNAFLSGNGTGAEVWFH